MTTSDVAYSTNNGQTWSPWGVAPPGYTSNNQMGSVAVAADGSRVVVSPFDGYGYPAYATSLGGAWTTCSGLPSGACVASDRSSPSTFYAVAPSQWVFGGSVTVYLSTNYGINFTQVNTIPVNWSDPHGNGERVAPRPVFGVPGEFWVSTYNALYRFTHAGSSVTAVPNVYEPLGGVGFGKAAPGQTHPTVFLSGTVQGVRGLHRCDDGTGATWVRINDDDHRYGNPSWMQGDQNIFGRCYVAAGGRGILYGDVSIVSPTVTPTSACGVSPCTDTPTGTPTMTPTLTPAPCLYLLHGCDNLTENGTWSGANASRGVVASCPVTNALPSEGSGCLAVTVLTGSTYNADMMNLSGFTPSHFAGYATLMADVYFPPEMVEGQGWAQLMLIGDSSSNGIWFQNLSSGLLTVTAGLKTYSFALDYPGALTSGMAISKLVFIFNAQNATTGTVYVDNIRLVNPCGVPTPTMTMTATLPFADTATFTPSPTPTESLTVTHTWTRTPTCAGTCVGTATLTETPTFTWTPSFTPTSTETPEVTHTPSRTATPDSAFQMPRSPVIPYPNPVREGDEVTVGVTLLEPGTAQVQLFTTAYRKMRETTLTALPMGFTPARIVLRDREDKPLANGVYFIRVISGDQISIGKLVIRR